MIEITHKTICHLDNKKPEHMRSTRNSAALFSRCKYLPFSPLMKNGATPDIFHHERHKFVKSIPPSHNGRVLGDGGWGGTHSWGGELHQVSPHKIFLQRKPSFGPDLLHMRFYWQGHEYVWVMSCSSERQRFTSVPRVGQIALDHVTCSR